MSSDCQRTVDSMIFDAVTTATRADFTGEQNKRYGPVTIPKRALGKTIRPASLKYQQTLEQWKCEPAHFALYLKRKEIVNTSPWEVQVYKKPPDDQHKLAVRTRPRLIAFAPTLSIDDIPEGEREIIVDSIYKSSQMVNEETVKGRCLTTTASKVSSPCPVLPAPAQPIPRLVVQPAAYVSPEWRMESVGCDGRQQRSYCHPTEHFWLNRNKGKVDDGDHVKSS